VWAICTRRTKLSDAAGRPTIIAGHAPESEVPIVTAALLLGKRERAIAAQILDFAVHGKLRILESRSSGLLSSHADYRLELVAATGVRSAELDILRAVLPTSLQYGAVRDLAKPNQELSQKLYKIIERENTRLVAGGFRRTVSASSYLPIALSARAASVSVFFGFAIVAAVAIVIALFRKAVTARGAEARDHLEGLELYI
jgi:hypothetical protein